MPWNTNTAVKWNTLLHTTWMNLQGIMLNKKPVSLRTAVLAACFLLCLTPESLLTPGFQLSFIAVFALLSFYETFKKHLNSPLKKMSNVKG